MDKRTLIIILLILPFLLFATNKQEKQENKVPEQKAVQAVRAVEPVEIDGQLRESVWQQEGFSDFVQSDPVDGGVPTEKTQVWIAYDDANLYVSAFMVHDDQEIDITVLRGVTLSV